MTPINSASSVSSIDFRRIDPVQQETPVAETSNNFNEVQRQADSQNAALISLLPENPAQDLFRVFTSINSLGLQAAEIGQTPEGRQGLQTEVEDELLSLRSTLDELTRDDLRLFAAVFESQLPNLFSNVDTSSSTSLLADSSLIFSSEPVLSSLFQIDLRTDQGVLSALDLAGSILDTFSVFNTGSGVSGSVFDDFLDFSFNLTLIDTILSSEPTESTTDSETGQETAETDSPLVSPESGQPTIIELAG